MKTILFVTTLLLCYALDSRAQIESADASGRHSIEMRPNDKRSLNVKDTERNPYAKRLLQDNIDENAEQSTEELTIRKKLSELKVTGSSQGRVGLRLLLGDILIERGRVLPQLLGNQTQHLKVIDVALDKIVLGWMDVENGALTGKTLQISYDLTPTVSYVLQGQNTGVTRKSQEMGLLRPQNQSAPPVQDFAN